MTLAVVKCNRFICVLLVSPTLSPVSSNHNADRKNKGNIPEEVHKTPIKYIHQTNEPKETRIIKYTNTFK